MQIGKRVWAAALVGAALWLGGSSHAADDDRVAELERQIKALKDQVATMKSGGASVAEIERQFDGARIWTEVARGDRLEDFESLEDGRSYRFGVVNLGAPDRTGLFRKFEEVRRALGYRFERL